MLAPQLDRLMGANAMRAAIGPANAIFAALPMSLACQQGLHLLERPVAQKAGYCP
jgi:hypothetical protein